MTVPLQAADCDYWLDEYLEFADPQEPRDYSWSDELKGFIARTEELTRAVEARGWDSTPLVVFVQALRNFYFRHRADFPMAGNAVRTLLERLKYNLEAQAGTTSPYHPTEADSGGIPDTAVHPTVMPADATVPPTCAAPTDAQSAVIPPVELHGQGKSPTVRGTSKPALTTPQYNVVSALLQAGERGLNKDELVRKSGHADARAILGRVADLDSDWMAVVQFAGKTAGRYRIG